MDDYDEGDDFIEEEPVAGLASWKDLGGVDPLGTFFEGDGLKKISRLVKSDLDKVMEKMYIYGKKLDDSDVLDIIKSDVFRRQVEQIKDLAYKSPQGILLGYMANSTIDFDRFPPIVIDKARLKEIFALGKHTIISEKEEITPANIISYARLWSRL